MEKKSLYLNPKMEADAQRHDLHHELYLRQGQPPDENDGGNRLRGLHLRRMGQSAGHHRLAGRNPRRTEPSALPRVRLRHGDRAVLSAEQVL